MLGMLQAIITKGHYTSTGLTFSISVPELDIEVNHKDPSTRLCREILAKYPEMDGPIEVREPEGKLRFTITSIKDHAGLTYSEGEKQGPHTRKFVLFNGEGVWE